MHVYALLLWLCELLVAVTGDKSVPLYKRDKTHSPQGPFKNWPLSTARGFGKRAVSDFAPLDSSQFVVRDSFPAEWFANELQNNGELARLIVHKFIDSNQDGELSADELLRPLFQQRQPTAVYKTVKNTQSLDKIT